MRIHSAIFDFVDLDRDPAGQSEFDCADELGRVIAHLAGQNGDGSHLLKVDDNGRVEVVLFDHAGVALQVSGNDMPYICIAGDTGGLQLTNDGAARIAATDERLEPTAGIEATTASGTLLTIDLGAAGNNLVKLCQNKDFCRVYASDSAGGKTKLIGGLPANVLATYFTTHRYIDIESTGSAAAWKVEASQWTLA